MDSIQSGGKRSDKREPQTIDAETGSPDPTPPKPARRIDLSTLRDVRIEMAALYRRVDAGELESQDGTRRAYILQGIAKLIEAAELEHRLSELEERLSTPGVRLPAPTSAAHLDHARPRATATEA